MTLMLKDDQTNLIKAQL